MRHRLLFYSHDSFGLGHFRRSLTIAGYVTRHIPDSSALMVTGLDSAATFEAPRGVDFVKLPGIVKAGPNEYQSRHLRVSFARVQRMREQLLHGVVRAFDPSLVVIDNVPRGVDGELLASFRYLRRRRPSTRIVLTLRDVLDAPDNIVPLWREEDVYHVLKDFYDEIWVVGCQAMFDPVRMYEFPRDVAEKVKFCGYVVRSSPAEEADDLAREFRLANRPFVLVSCGGGGDGFGLLETYAETAEALAHDGIGSVVFIGPDMPVAERRHLKQKLLPLSEHVLTFDYRPDLVSFLALATVSVSMGGYNTLSEIMSMRKTAIVVPRTYPRTEQLIRAQAFSDHGLLSFVHPRELSPATLEAAIRSSLERARGPQQQKLPDGMDFAGLTRIVRRAKKQLGWAEVAEHVS